MKPRNNRVYEILAERFIDWNWTHEHAPPGMDCNEKCKVSLADVIAASNPYISPVRSGGKKHRRCLLCWRRYINQLADMIDASYKKEGNQP